MEWNPSFPESFSFYGLGEVTREAAADAQPTLPYESALAFEVIGDESASRAWIVFASSPAPRDEAMEAELANVLASRIAGSWISPPRAIEGSLIPKILNSSSLLQSFRYSLKTSSRSVPLHGWILASLTGGSGHA